MKKHKQDIVITGMIVARATMVVSFLLQILLFVYQWATNNPITGLQWQLLLATGVFMLVVNVIGRK